MWGGESKMWGLGRVGDGESKMSDLGSVGWRKQNEGFRKCGVERAKCGV